MPINHCWFRDTNDYDNHSDAPEEILDSEPIEPVPILEEVPTGTTIAPGVIDPYAEMPSVPADAYVVPCE